MSIEELALNILNETPNLKELAKGKDPKYVKWFEEVLKLSRNKIFPYGFDDGGYSLYKTKKLSLRMVNILIIHQWIKIYIIY